MLHHSELFRQIRGFSSVLLHNMLHALVIRAYVNCPTVCYYDKKLYNYIWSVLKPNQMFIVDTLIWPTSRDGDGRGNQVFIRMSFQITYPRHVSFGCQDWMISFTSTIAWVTDISYLLDIWISVAWWTLGIEYNDGSVKLDVHIILVWTTSDRPTRTNATRLSECLGMPLNKADNTFEYQHFPCLPTQEAHCNKLFRKTYSFKVLIHL